MDQVKKRNLQMLVRKTKKDYRQGVTGKVYPTKKEASKQCRAIEANKRRKNK